MTQTTANAGKGSSNGKNGGRVGVRAAFFEASMPVKVVLAGVLINRLGSFLNLFLVLYLTSKGFSTEQAAFALTAYGGGAVAGVLAGGTLASKLGPRNATVISMSGTFLIMGSWLYLPSYPVLLAAAIVVSLISQLYRPASATLLSDLTADDRQVMTFALYRFGLNLGATAAPLIGLALYYLAGHKFTLVFWGEALIALAYAVLAWVALPRAPKSQGDADSSPAAAGPGAGGQSSGYLTMLRDWRYCLFLLAIGVHSAVYVQYLSTLPLNIKQAGIAIGWYTLAVSLNGLVVIAFELLVTKVTQYWPMRLSIALTLGLLGVGVALYGLPFGPAVILGGTLVWSLGEIIGGPATYAYPAATAPAGLKPQYIGSLQFMFGLGTAAGPAIGGWLLVRLGHDVWPVLAIGSGIATALVLIAVRQAPEQPEPAPALAADPAQPSPVAQ
ncbi:MAG TPA: MFS transporter [Streptosporangiaceae bacterium]|nr:MFS transporter [Streptosporangiaceae bacterium]